MNVALRLRRSRAGLLSLALAVAAGIAPTLDAETWLVGGDGSDFAEIQPAIDAAVRGDVVLVRPGAYLPFVLGKGVLVRASAAPFHVKGTVRVAGVPAAELAAISGLEIDSNGRKWILELEDCVGEVVLESVTLRGQWWLGPLPQNLRLSIDRCANVSIDGLTASTSGQFGLVGDHPTVAIRDSHVRMASVDITAPSGRDAEIGSNLDGGDGGTALELIGSLVVLTRPDVRGGGGGRGSCDSVFFPCGEGGRGGDAVVAIGSELVLVGTAAVDDRLVGGDGGDGSAAWDGSSCAPGGGGGDGLFATGGAADVSRVGLVGGDGGDGAGSCPDGTDGDEWSGNVAILDATPALAATPDWNPGDPISIVVDGVAPALAAVIVSDRGGFADHRAQGPPLSVGGGTFELWLFTATDAAGDLTLSGVLPDAAWLQGIPVHVQSVLHSTPGRSRASNAVTRVVGE